MYYDLNVPFSSNTAELKQRISFLAELGYNVIAISYNIQAQSGKDPEIVPLPFTPPSSIKKVLTRCNIKLDQVPANVRITTLRKTFDIICLRPTDERTLAQACSTLDADIISLDLSIRYFFPFKFKMIGSALERGIKFEICYGHGIYSSDEGARRNLMQNASGLVRSSRGRGLVISSEAQSAIGCRSPYDIINLATLWGLKQDVATEAVTDAARKVVAAAQLRKRSFKGAITLVQGYEKPTQTAEDANGKRKANEDVAEEELTQPTDQASKRKNKKTKEADQDKTTKERT